MRLPTIPDDHLDSLPKPAVDEVRAYEHALRQGYELLASAADQISPDTPTRISNVTTDIDELLPKLRRGLDELRQAARAANAHAHAYSGRPE